MIYRILNSILFFFLIFIHNNSNPIKLRINLLILRIIVFEIIHHQTSNTWYPLIFFLIFIGGILIIFIILSSILPNEKRRKGKMRLVIIPVLIIIILKEGELKLELERSSNLIKIILDSSNSLLFLIRVILIYFFVTLKTLTKEDNPLRSHLCHKHKKFCKFLIKKWQF